MERRASMRPPAIPGAEDEAWPATAPPAGAGRGVRFEHVDLTFGGAKRRRTVRALTDVSFAVGDREFCAIVGPSGCGKSTLLNLASGLRPATAGTVYVDERPVRGLVRDIGYVTQDSNLLPWLTVEDNIRLPLQIRGMPAADQESLVARWIGLVGLDGFRQSYPRQLSGGMQKRCSIARTLVYDPPILLMDEPFGALDAMTKAHMQDTLLKLWEGRPKTVLFVTHDLSEALALADKVVVITSRPGRVRTVVPVDIERPRDVFHTSEHPEFSRQHRALWDMFADEVTLGAKK
ncbi:MAG TPA: ABC transporter ATP-binding protein [Trebonia sp.]|jgi:NitT/TauT family transport system ATP-binding protein|nr:ABC transporter ATP-binding protein [Trebonia sp.]